MGRWRRRVPVLLLLGLLLCLAHAPAAFADVNDFTVTSFNADQTLDNGDPQGRMHVVEHIAVDFTDHNHGITRSLPQTYKKHRLQLHINKVSSPSGAPASYSTSTENGQLVLKIGSASRTVTGHQEYVIDYTEDNVISFYPDHDELYWDINGNGWDQQFDSVTSTLHVPAGAQLAPAGLRAACFTGYYGTTDHDCTQTAAAPSTKTIITTSSRLLLPQQTLSTVVGFQKGYFKPSTPLDTAMEYKADAIAGLAACLILAVPAGVYWYRRGRDPKGRGTIVPEYDVPDDLRPIEAGTLIDFKTDNRDISATLIDLAVRGYIKIIEEKKKQLLGHKLEYTLELRNTDTASLKPFETKLLQALFPAYSQGAQMSVTRSVGLVSAASDLRKDVSKDLTTRGYFAVNPYYILGYAVLGVALATGFVIFCMSAFHAPGGGIVGAVAGGLIAAVFAISTPSRTAQGVAANEKLLGLKLFLQVTESDRLQKLQGPDAPYAANASAPVKTVELFEKLLPYAMVLGVEKQWAKQFESLYITPPDWYSGNWTTFNAVYLASSITDNMSSSVTSAFAASNSSGSGFGGGGAGGGGGGGGGGGW